MEVRLDLRRRKESSGDVYEKTHISIPGESQGRNSMQGSLFAELLPIVLSASIFYRVTLDITMLTPKETGVHDIKKLSKKMPYRFVYSLSDRGMFTLEIPVFK